MLTWWRHALHDSCVCRSHHVQSHHCSTMHRSHMDVTSTDSVCLCLHDRQSVSCVQQDLLCLLCQMLNLISRLSLAGCHLVSHDSLMRPLVLQAVICTTSIPTEKQSSFVQACTCTNECQAVLDASHSLLDQVTGDTVQMQLLVLHAK